MVLPGATDNEISINNLFLDEGPGIELEGKGLRHRVDQCGLDVGERCLGWNEVMQRHEAGHVESFGVCASK